MKCIILISILLGLGAIYAYPQDSIVSIPDTAFLYALIDEGVDTNGDSLISYAEAETPEVLDISYRGIGDMTGIEAFVNLDTLFCIDNLLTSLDVSNNTALKFLHCGANDQFTSLDVSGCTVLEELYCGGDQLSSLDVSNNPALIRLWCGGDQFSSLDVSKNTALIELKCLFSQLTSLDVSKNTALKRLGCDYNQLTSLDVSENADLEELSFINNQLISLDVSNNTALKHLNCGGNQLTSLDVSKNAALVTLDCSSNQLTNLDVSENADLEVLSFINNQLTSLDVSKHADLEELWCGGNQLTSLDVSNNLEMEVLDCDVNQITSLDVTNNTALKHLNCGRNELTTLDISCNDSIGRSSKNGYRSLIIWFMPTLNEICVSESFHPDSVNVLDSGSENYQYNSNCGKCSAVGTFNTSPSQMQIYPNPANDIFTIQSDNITEYSIKITSLNGQLIYTNRIKGTTHQIDLSSFEKGLYFITIRSRDYVRTEKIIKQ